MSDFSIRLFERIYDSEPTFENARRLIAAYKRAKANTDNNWPDLRLLLHREIFQATNGDLSDLPVLDFNLNMLEDIDLEQHREIVDWVERVASLASTQELNWHYLVYIGLLDNEDIDSSNFARIKNIRNTADWANANQLVPTPLILIPIIDQAHSFGADYISFNL